MLDSKVVIVTGAASGIGRSAAVMFAKYGAKVIVADIDEKGAIETVGRIKASRLGEAIFEKTDVSNSRDTEACVRASVEKFGRLDCLFSNAGINPTGTVEDTSEELWERVLSINLKGMYLMCKASIPEMKRAGGGSIVCTSSVDGVLAIHNEAAYIASKGGVIALTRSIALDFAKDRIRANCILPGAIRTPLLEKFLAENPSIGDQSGGHAMGRIGEPEEVASMAMYLLSDASSFVTGAVIPVDGGYSAVKT
ncbi:MAG: SDR family oxidoreductase [Thaumarchaeota archaeon]|nr:SDR family oxidoreductase [Nitrososphaerota archaeon]